MSRREGIKGSFPSSAANPMSHIQDKFREMSKTALPHLQNFTRNVGTLVHGKSRSVSQAPASSLSDNNLRFSPTCCTQKHHEVLKVVSAATADLASSVGSAVLLLNPLLALQQDFDNRIRRGSQNNKKYFKHHSNRGPSPEGKLGISSPCGVREQGLEEHLEFLLGMQDIRRLGSHHDNQKEHQQLRSRGLSIQNKKQQRQHEVHNDETSLDPFQKLKEIALAPLALLGHLKSKQSKSPSLSFASLSSSASQSDLPNPDVSAPRTQSSPSSSSSPPSTNSNYSNSVSGGNSSKPSSSTGGSRRRARENDEEERVLVSEILIKDWQGQDLEDPVLLEAARSALKASKPNLALLANEVEEDVERIIDTGFFLSCLPCAEDTRDGLRLTFKVEPNRVMTGVNVRGANVLPARVVQDAFAPEFGKVMNVGRLTNVIDEVNKWYYDRGLFGQVTDISMGKDGKLSVTAAEAEVKKISIKFRDRKTGEPTTGKTRPETLLRQLMTKPGQVYSLQQGKKDVEAVFTMGIMEDVNVVPVPHMVNGEATGMVDLTMNVVERKPGGFSAGGGLSGSSISSGALLSGLIGSFAYSHRNAFGRNQKLNVSVERGQVDFMFRFNYTDPWLTGDQCRTSRTVSIQTSRSPGSTIHGPPAGNGADGGAGGGGGPVTIGRTISGVEWSRPLRPNWSGTGGVNFQRAGARDGHGQPRLRDAYNCPLTFSSRSHDNMLVGKLEMAYTDSADDATTQLVTNLEQGVPVASDWLFFNRLTLRARRGFRFGPLRLITSFSGGTVFGDLAPYDAFPIGGTNSVRGYDEGAVGTGRSYVVGSVESSFKLVGPIEGVVFADYGSDLGSGHTVLGDPAGARGKPGRGHGIGAGVRLDSPLGPLRLEYAYNAQGVPRFHFGIGYRS
eukprot:TRINITY_DN1213_c0_g1_i1.p1 TRINITY_DN1213_c0_g1~~TRINITY_DN1213_c0_g1_i1.p1  ORF type:complete len:900 (+),score=147.38 TRINITY_DN1213_c0_g1_i1:214-2913(+)